MPRNKLNGIKVLMVEDNLDHQDLILWTLKEHNPKMDITSVENGSECLEFIEKATFDMILLDYNLPDMNGIDVLKTIRDKGCNVPVIFISGVGAGNEKIAIEALKVGACDFIGKVGNYFETLPVVIQQNLEKIRMKKMKDELEKKLEEQEMRLKIANTKLKKLSLTDSLTNLFNQRCFYDRLNEELKRSKRYERPLSVILMDLDKYKGLNDKYGHQYGDYILKTVAHILRESSRETNIIARYGGDEFAMILPNTDFTGAEVIAKRILENIGMYEFSMDGKFANLTTSMGISSFPVDLVSGDPANIVSLADKALYAAKEKGGNCYMRYLHDPARVADTTNLSDLQKQVNNLSEEMKHKVMVFIKNFIVSAAGQEDNYYLNSSMVMELSVKLAKELKLPERDIEILKCAVILHDIGMIGIQRNVIEKQGKLTDDEYAVVKSHPMIAADIMKRIDLFKKELPIVIHHHEYYNGDGYPYGMKAGKIPAGSRILAIVDAYDSMVNGRIWRNKLSPSEARRELLLNAGTQFDPGFTNTFIRIVKEVETR